MKCRTVGCVRDATHELVYTHSPNLATLRRLTGCANPAALDTYGVPASALH